MKENFIAERVTQITDQKKISYYRMSYELGQSRSYMCKVASGEIKPSMSSFFAICDYLEVTPAEFFDPTITKETRAILNLILKLPEQKREMIVEIVTALLNDDKKAIPKKFRHK